jgi:SAM-dependent methyltransferase
MHPTAMNNGREFFSTYSKFFNGSEVTVVDIGAQDVNGSLREACPTTFKYIGVDFQDAKGVDVVITDPYKLPFDDQSVDIVVSSSCFEHSEMFWLSFLEILRILKPTGLFSFNAPSDGAVHKYPVDCWRFYPDSGQALVNWSNRNNFDSILLECYTQIGGGWQDYVAIFLKDKRHISLFTDRILNHKKDFENGTRSDKNSVLNAKGSTQNERKIRSRTLKGILKKLFLIDLLRSIFKPTSPQP